MGDKIVIGPFNKGLKNDVTAFNIDNDNFPRLENAYQWRGRVKRKRGTSLLGRLQRAINTSSIKTDGAGNFSGNILTTLEANASVVFGSISIGADLFSDTAIPSGVLTGSLGGTGTINYSTGALTIAGGPLSTNIIFSYYPALPVMDIEDLISASSAFPGTVAFDTKYAYNVSTASPYTISDVSFYKNPPTQSINGAPYVAKTTLTPVTWNGNDYQQFYSVNYQGALWVSNGIDIPFTGNTLGMQFKTITGIANVTAGPPAKADLTIVGSGLSIGDWIFVNEIGGTTGINYQTGFVSNVVGNIVTVYFPYATLGGAYTSGGIAQYLTNRSNTALDCLRWYDGNPAASSGLGFVNFCPPLSNLSYSIADLPQAQYYLVGARMIIPFKDRQLFIGPVVQSSGGGKVYLQDTVIYSQNGTAYYTSSFTGDQTIVTTVFHGLLLPVNQTATASAYFEDIDGYGGFITAGIDQPATTVASMDDVLGIGFSTIQTKVVYTGNDLLPFVFYTINSELGSSSTFSTINMDKSSVTIGSRGFVATSQTSASRIDLDIPDEIFEIRLLDNGTERVTAQRDFKNEWIYFSYPYADTAYKYPTRTLQYNYRDQSWAVFNETYTAYGQFRRTTGATWATIGTFYPTWADWNDPWNDGVTEALEATVIGGNQQGFLMQREVGTSEGTSLFISSISGNTITVHDHSLNTGDYIVISGCIGTIANQLNSQIFSVTFVTTDTFILNPAIVSGTYLGGGLITRMYSPLIQTKQFPPAWANARKTRLGPQQYLLSTTQSSQITLLIYLSEDSSSTWNTGPVIPHTNVDNSGLIYSTVLYTCPESTNLGLTPANTNLQMPTAVTQQQIWHRVNTSLLGDTVQLGFTLSDTQMRSLTPSGAIFTITAISKATQAIVTVANTLAAGQLVMITGVLGMTQINSTTRFYCILAATATNITLALDSTAFSVYTSAGSVQNVAPLNQFAEIVLHGAILDVSASAMLA